MENSLTDSVLVRETMLVRHQMFDELVLARKASTQDAARTMVEMAVEAGRRGMSGSDVTSQIAFASIMPEATMVRTVMAFMDGMKVETWSRKLSKWSSFWIASGQKNQRRFAFFDEDLPDCAVKQYCSQETVLVKEICIVNEIRRWHVCGRAKWHDWTSGVGSQKRTRP